MNIIPIAFAFDNNLIMPAAVAFTSLLKNAAPETFYDIYILHSEKEELDKFYFSKIVEEFQNCKINYITVGNIFEGAFEIRDITTPTYYRLLIPKLIPQYNKIIYADVDIIFRLDLSDLYSIDLGVNYLAATNRKMARSISKLYQTLIQGIIFRQDSSCLTQLLSVKTD